MSSSLNQRALEIFDKVVDLEGDDRSEQIERLCAGDEDLRSTVQKLLELAEGTRTGRLVTEGGGIEAVVRDVLPGSVELPEQIGRYRILSEIGRGGMGVVFEAEQDDPKRRVALKVVRRDLASAEVLRRFRRESQLLGRLEHPGIAQIFEAGTSEGGSPYFAMELIRGQPLDAFLNERSPSRDDVIRLFEQICDAVQHAHQKGVIHRDLKPANVLIWADAPTEAGDALGYASTISAELGSVRPKILDFGVARLVESEDPNVTVHTQAGQIMGTLAYMSPEQFGNDPGAVDARSDIYSIGVMLYRALSGTMPHDFGSAPLAEVARIVTETDPKPLGSIEASLRGDLETIVAAAMSRDPDRRYASAASLGEDLRRFRHDEPISARPASALYQLSKFARRNRALVGGALVSVLILIAGVIGTSTGLLSALRANAALEQRNEQLAEVSRFQQTQLARIDPENMGATLREYLVANVPEDELRAFEHGLARSNLTTAALQMLESDIFQPTRTAIEAGFSDQAEVRASLLQSLGVTTGELGLPEIAIPVLREAESTYAGALGPEATQTLDAQQRVAKLLVDQARYDEAEQLYKSTGDAFSEKDGGSSAGQLRSELYLAQLVGLRGDHESAAEQLRELLDRLRDALGADNDLTLSAIYMLANSYNSLGRDADAVALLEQLVELRTTKYGADDPRTCLSMGELAVALVDLGRYDDAEELARNALEASQRTRGDDHHVTLSLIGDLAWALHNRGDLVSVETLYRDLIQRLERAKGPDHPDSLATRNNLASVIDALGRLDEAEPLYRRNLEGYERVLGADHPSTLAAMNNLGFIMNALGDPEAARALYAEVFARSTEALGPDHPDTIRSMGNLATSLVSLGEVAEGLELQKRALEANQRVLGSDNPATFIGLYRLGDTLRIQGRLDEAEPYCLEALERYESLSPTHQGTLFSLQLVARLRDDQGRVEEADLAYRTAWTRQEDALGSTNPLTVATRLDHAFMFLNAGRATDSEQLFLALQASLNSAGASDSPDAVYTGVGLARSVLDQGRVEDAAPLLTDALARSEEVLGPEDRRTIVAVRAMGALHEAQGRSTEAVPLYERALTWAESNRQFNEDMLREIRTDLQRANAASKR
ncbi:MAG: serine/threonine-protein kinase [Planctomycetota bacterium]